MSNDPLLRILTKVISSHTKLKEGFKKKNWQDFYLFDYPQTNDPKRFVAYMLRYFAYTKDGKPNEFQEIALHAAMIFLNEYAFTRGSIQRAVREICNFKSEVKDDDVYEILEKYLVEPSS